jgi:hypothetical protein
MIEIDGAQISPSPKSIGHREQLLPNGVASRWRPSRARRKPARQLPKDLHEPYQSLNT